MNYLSPLAPQRADPYLYKHTDGKYYFTATCPKYDKIEIRSADTVDGIASPCARGMAGAFGRGKSAPSPSCARATTP